MTSIARRVHDRALRHPDAVAVSDGPRQLTYAELNAGAAAVAESLSRRGVRPGDAVAVGLPRSAELILVMLGVLRLGAQVVPLDRQSPPARRDVILADAGAVVVFDELPDLLAGTAEAGVPAGPAPASFLFYTSGTTGRPKGVEVRDAGVLRLAEPGWLDIGTQFACLANPAFDAISFEVWVPLLTGGTCVILDDETVRDPQAFAGALVRERIDTMFVTATLFNAVAETVPGSFATVRRVVIGGEQLNAPLIRRWYRANPDAPTRLQNGYGPTETTTFALSYAIPRGFDGEVVPIGRPLPGTGAVAVTADERVAAEGELAELYLSGAGVALGYRGLPAETGQRFVRLPWFDEGRARFYRTGDLVRVLPGGRYAYAGRTDRQVKVRGFRIEPGELEQRLLAHPAIRQAHVAVRRAATAELLAFVVADELSFDSFDAHLSETVPAYMRPHHVFRVEELPRNANGKVDEAALLAGGFTPWRPDAGGEATAWEREVLDVVSAVLGIPDARPVDTWLRSGGDSLKALRLRFAIRERWGADLAPSVVQHGTFADLAAAVSSAGHAAYPAVAAPTTATAAPATSEQQRLWLLQQRNPASTAYHVPLAFRVTGEADVDALRRGVRDLVERHPALRTAFEATPDGLRQVAKAPYDPWTEPDDELFTAPFDLGSGRLLRAAWRPDGTFLLCLHHIAVDGWSLNILFRELSGAPPRPGAPTPFDFAAWQSRWFASPGYRAQLTTRHDDSVPAGEASLKGRLRTTTIGRERVDEWAGELGLTRFQLLLGVFAWSLYAVTGRTRPRIAAPVANRPVREFEDSVGMFANTVRLPLSVDPDEELGSQLRRLGAVSGAALDHQDVAFADLDPGYAAFDYLFVLENTDFGALELPGCSVSPQWIEATEAKCALTLSVVERPDGFDCLWEYGEGHFTEAEAAALGDVFARALGGGARTPAELAEPYRRDHGRGAVAELTWETVADGFARQVARTPAAPALTGETTLTYAELDAHAARLAATLPADATDIALYFRPSAEHVVALLALARLNITAVPLDPAYPPELLREMLDRVRPRCVLLAPGEAFETDVERRFVTLTGGPVPDVPVRHAGRPLYTLFTSGSTGVPKGVRVPDRTLANLLQWQDAPPAATQQFSMLSFDVSFQEIFTTLCGGGRLHLIRPEWRHDVPALLDRLETAGIERIFLPYVALQLLAEHGVRLGRYPARLRDVITAGEQLVCTPAIRRWFAGLPGARLHNHYGPTETHVVSALTLDGDPAGWPDRPAIGRPVHGAVLRVADATGAPLPPGQVGELLIGGLAANRCYLGEAAPGKFAELPELYYRSGDLAHFDRAGLLHFDGRADRQVKLSGHRLELGQVEAALLRHPDVVNAVVVPEGDRLAAFLECRRTPSAAELAEHLVPLLPPHARVDRFRVVAALPRTPSGKLDRDAAPRTAGEDLHRTSAAPSSELAALFEEVTGAPIGPDETFFAAGATSLSLMRFHLRCAEAGYRFTAADLFEHVTLRDLTRHLESGGPAPAASSSRPGADEAVAVVGMAVRLPGAPDLAAFWDLVVSGRRGIEEFPAADGLVGARSLLDRPLAFDPEHFGISHRDAALMDPQQRQLLMACVEALAHAGLAEPGRTGLIAGCGENTYFQQMLREADPAALPDGFQLALHHEKDFLATKVAYHLDLTGPALTTQTACSSSLVAVHQAAAMLRGGEAEVMLAGGVLVDVTLAEGYRYRPQHIFSPDGHCRPFSDDADGTVGGSGVGVVVLKPLSAARRDGDTVYAVITGSALTNDGAVKQGYSAPSPAGQRAAIRAALRRAGRSGADVGYVETHGTGTRLGDPIEVSALREAMPESAGCALSSVKSQLGHLGAAAGVVGLIRAALAVHHGVVPPTVDFRAPNPALDLGPFRVPTRAEPWPAGPRVAGVSSFGIGGTNAHVILESVRPVPVPRPEPVRCLVLSARSAPALRLEAARVAEYLTAHPSSYVDVLRHLQSGRPPHRWRLAAACEDAPAAVEWLRTAEPHELSRESSDLGPALSRESSAPHPALSRESAGLADDWLAGGAVDWGHSAAPAPWDFPPPAFDARDFDFPRKATVTRRPESEWLHQPTWVRLRRAANATPTDRVLVISGEGPLTAPALDAAYPRVVRVHAADRFARLGPDTFEADPADTASLRRILDSLPDTRIDWLHTLPLGVTGPVSEASVDHAKWACLDTPAALLRAARDRPLRTWWVSAGAAPANTAVTRPEAGLLAGVTAVGPQESGVPGHWADLDGPDLDPLADLLTGPTPPERVALRTGFWWVQDTAPVSAGEPVPHEGIHLILGGTGGIGTAVAEELLTRTTGRVLLLARRPFLPEALKPWADRVDLFAADLTTVTADEITTPLAGIVHAAGNPDGSLIATRGESTQPVKLAGALLTEQLVERHRPAYVVYCSSLSAQFGGIGQLDYAAANGFLDALAHLDGPTARLSIGWDVWRDSGMAVTALETDARHQAHLAVGLTDDEGRRTFARALGSGLPQLLVTTTGLETARTFHERDTTTPAAKPAEADLTEEVRALLGVAELDPDVPLYDLGADSLTLLDVVDSVKRLFGVDLDLAWLGPEVTMAKLLAQLGTAAGTGDVVVQVWREGDGREVVCLVHPVGGDVHAYRPLVEALPPELGVCVIADPALSRPEPPGWTVADRARRYHAALGARFPGHSRQLAGWSFGAWVAAGMAAEAEAAGQPVRALHLIDPPPPGASAADYSDAQLETVFERELGASGGTAGEHARRLARACRANLRSMAGHELPRLAATPSHIWLATEPEPGLPVAGRDGWRALLPEPSRWHDLPATHYGIVRAPHVTAVAAAIANR
ncbi:amino acid adenylation domain-containing protein [Amycolatopsis sp. A133]|uniref:non-ribosomal peptide synthetase n=1 Tax=Amycolatopsis sp. A133 TaxID=3064472 RepID=UPI0027F47E24|nr:non-ribosomal peptide synthetase [Amycolatopsis sp. A133]MDQ7808686.1 amino acid adenylation domain-containing protein [Amycolatopsis sp. A133]